MKKWVCPVFALCFLALTAGCSSAQPDEDTISLDKKGKVTVTIVEDFDKDYYDEDELSDEIDEEVAQYNINFATDRVTLEEFKVEDGTAVLKLSFEAARYYADYMDVTLYAGTVGEAEEEGYDLSADFIDTDGNVIGIEDIEGFEDKNILILEEAFAVEVNGSVVAAGPYGNVTITGKDTVSVAEDELSYIIYE